MGRRPRSVTERKYRTIILVLQTTKNVGESRANVLGLCYPRNEEAKLPTKIVTLILEQGPTQID